MRFAVCVGYIVRPDDIPVLSNLGGGRGFHCICSLMTIFQPTQPGISSPQDPRRGNCCLLGLKKPVCMMYVELQCYRCYIIYSLSRLGLRSVIIRTDSSIIGPFTLFQGPVDCFSYHGLLQWSLH